MAKQYRFRASDLQPNQHVMVAGEVVYSHIFTRIEGKELEDDIARAKNIGRMPNSDSPYTALRVCNASVQFANPSAPTPEEQFIEERLFDSQSDKRPGKNYDAKNRSSFMPWVGEWAPDNKSVNQIQIHGELAVGLKVVLVLRTYKTDRGINLGFSLDGVILNEPIRYYENSYNDPLRQFGIGFNPLPADQPARVGNTSRVSTMPDNSSGTSDAYSAGSPVPPPPPVQAPPASGPFDAAGGMNPMDPPSAAPYAPPANGYSNIPPAAPAAAAPAAQPNTIAKPDMAQGSASAAPMPPAAGGVNYDPSQAGV